jgi:hypothetical protein
MLHVTGWGSISNSRKAVEELAIARDDPPQSTQERAVATPRSYPFEERACHGFIVAPNATDLQDKIN